MEIRGSVFLIPIFIALFAANSAFAARTELISKSPSGAAGDGNSENPSVSDNGRYVVFESTAKNLVGDKTTSHSDIFLYDRITKKNSRISKTAFDEANSSSYDGAISADGTVIVFSSNASNLVANDTGGNRDIFAYDRTTSLLTRVSISSNGTAANDNCDNPDVSENGRYVVFQSAATNLVGGDNNGVIDIFRHDRVTGTTVRINFFDYPASGVTEYDSIEPVVSNDARYIAFETRTALRPCDDNNTTDVYVRDIVQGRTTLGSATYWDCVANSSSHHPSISADGRFVSFSSTASNLILTEDTNGLEDVFIRDRSSMITERISIASSGAEGNARSVGYGGNISANGRYVTFSSPASNLAEDSNTGYDVFVRDRTANKTTREGLGTYWEAGTGDSGTNTAAISSSGKYVVFDSSADGLVPGDNNNHWDVFIRDYLWTGPLITAINPSSGDFHGGTLLTITGSNFRPGAAVVIGGKPALNVAINAAGTKITCITPPHDVGSVELKVTNTDGTSWLYPIGLGGFNGYIYRPLAMPFLGILLL